MRAAALVLRPHQRERPRHVLRRHRVYRHARPACSSPCRIRDQKLGDAHPGPGCAHLWRLAGAHPALARAPSAPGTCRRRLAARLAQLAPARDHPRPSHPAPGAQHRPRLAAAGPVAALRGLPPLPPAASPRADPHRPDRGPGIGLPDGRLVGPAGPGGTCPPALQPDPARPADARPVPGPDHRLDQRGAAPAPRRSAPSPHLAPAPGRCGRHPGLDQRRVRDPVLGLRAGLRDPEHRPHAPARLRRAPLGRRARAPHRHRRERRARWRSCSSSTTCMPCITAGPTCRGTASGSSIKPSASASSAATAASSMAAISTSSAATSSAGTTCPCTRITPGPDSPHLPPPSPAPPPCHRPPLAGWRSR